MIRSAINRNIQKLSRNKPNASPKIVPIKLGLPKIISSSKGGTSNLNPREALIDANIKQSVKDIPTPQAHLDVPNGLLSKLNIDNVDFIYPITLIHKDKPYILLQFSGSIYTTFGEIKSIHPLTGLPTTSVYLLSCDTNGVDSYIDGGTFLWCYDGIRENYQYAEMSFMSTGDLMVLSSYTGNVTFIQNTLHFEYITINHFNEGNYFVARFNLNTELGFIGDLSWVLPIIAFGDQNIEMVLDNDDYAYLSGTYQNKFKIGFIDGSSLTSNLINDMFIVKIKHNADIAWLRTTDKTSVDDTEGSTGSIRSESITLNFSDSNSGGEPRLTIVGQFNSKFKYNNFVLDSQAISFNMWVAQFNLNGDMQWLISPESDLNNQPDDYVDVYEIIYDSVHQGNLFIAGVLKGEFKFNTNVGATDDVIFIAELSVNGTWVNYNYIRTELPKSELDWYPHLTFGDSLYVSFFGWGDVYFNNPSGTIVPGNGIINLWVNKLTDNIWGDSPEHISGNVTNPSKNICYNDETRSVIIIGTYIVTFTNTNGYLRQFLGSFDIPKEQ